MPCNEPTIQPPELCVHAVIPSPDLTACATSQMWEGLGDNFTVPACGNVGQIRVCSNMHYEIGGYVWILGAGYFEVVGRAATTILLVKNNCPVGNVAPATVIGIDAPVIQLPPLNALALSSCEQAKLWEETVGDFTVPAVGADDTIEVCNNENYAIGAYVWLFDGTDSGVFEITDNTTPGELTLQNNGTLGNSAPAVVIDSPAIMIQVAPPPVNATWLTGTAAYAGGTPTAAVPVTVAVTVTGAALGDYVIAAYDKTLNGNILTAYVSAADTVTALIANTIAAGTAVAAGNVNVIVIPL